MKKRKRDREFKRTEEDKKREEERTKELEVKLGDIWSNVAYDRNAANNFSLFGTLGNGEDSIVNAPSITFEEREKKIEEEDYEKKKIILKNDPSIQSFKKKEILSTSLFDFYNQEIEIIKKKDDEDLCPSSYFMRTERMEVIKEKWSDMRELHRKIYKNMLKTNLNYEKSTNENTLN